MRTFKLLSIIFLWHFSSGDVLRTYAQISDEQAYLLPWETIAEEFHKGSWFYGDKDPLRVSGKEKVAPEGIRGDSNINNSYVFHSNQPIAIKLQEGTKTVNPSDIINVNLSIYEKGSWQQLGENKTNTKPNMIIVKSGIEKEGFYKLSYVLKTQNREPHEFQAYVIVCSNWKKDILTFCRKMKEELELNPDPQLIRSCIAISHFDHTMVLVSENSSLSSRILKTLTEAVWSKKVFESGQYPDLVIGLNKIKLRRFEGAQIAEFIVVVPSEYISSEKWPLFLHPDPRRIYAPKDYSEQSGYVDVFWHFSMPLGFDWKDYIYLLRVLYEKLNINENRVYVNGECGNGIAAIALALQRPDYWAECSASLGNSYRHLAGNALNLPLIFVKGGHNEDSFVGYYDFAVKCFKYHGCRHFKWNKDQEVFEARGTTQPTTFRESNPERVFYTIDSLEHSKAYWVNIKGREDENLPGMIDAFIKGQTVTIKIVNIDAYVLDLTQAPLDEKKPVEIIENGKNLGLTTDNIFTKESEKYNNAKYIKNTCLHGPVWDAFTDPYVVVWGARRKELLKDSERIAKLLANGGLCFSDCNVPENLVESRNLILVGTVESNAWLEKIYNQLPVRIERNSLITNRRNYEKSDFGLILIYPNPLNYQKYVAVFSGTSPRAMQKIHKAYSLMKAIRPADIAIFEITDSDSIKWWVIEKFNTIWNWHDGWDRTMLLTDKEHPKWQWRQWITKILRNQLGADVLLCEEPLIFKDFVPTGHITYRDLFNTFNNVWLIKVRMSGKVLRELLTAPFKDITKRNTGILIVDGISLFDKPVQGSGHVLSMNELVDGTLYTVVLPEKCLNGQKMGMVLHDYQIINQAYLIPVLREYLSDKTKANIDTQLDSLKLNVF